MDVEEVIALAEATLAAGNGPEARRVLRETVAVASSDAFVLGAAQVRLGWLEDALASLDTGLMIDPGAAPAWYVRGVVLHELKRPDDALASYDRAIENDPRLAVAFLSRGIALHDLGRLQEALASYDAAIEIDSLNAAALTNRGNVLGDLDRPEEALASHERALEVDPRLAAACLNRGGALRALGRREEALASYDRALEIEPRLARAWFGRGVMLQELGRSDDAVASHDRAIAIDPRHAPTWAGRGQALRSLERPDEAIASYDAAIEIDPRLATAWLGRGAVLVANPRIDREQSGATGLRCLQRSAALLRASPHVDNLRLLIATLHTYADVPLLVRGLIEDFAVLPARLGDEARLVAIQRDTEPSTALLRWLAGEDDATGDLPEPRRLLAVGQVYLAFGDPPRALQTLDEHDSIDPNDLAGQLYLSWAMIECLEESTAQIAGAVELARAVASRPDASERDFYYAGHILSLGDDPAAAIGVLERAGAWPPAVAMRWLCAQRTGDSARATEALDALVEIEAGWLAAGTPRSLLFPQALPAIDLRRPNGLGDLEWLLHVHEVAEAAGAILAKLDALRETHPPVARLLAAVERGGRDDLGTLAERRRAWSTVASFAGEMKERRLAASTAALAGMRARLATELGDLDVAGRDDLVGDALRDHLARRLQQMDFARLASGHEEALALLFLERRLFAQAAVLLILYARARRAQDLGRTGRGARLATKSMVALLMAVPLKLMGLDGYMAFVSSCIGIGVVEFAEFLQLAGRFRSGGGPRILTFVEFVDDLHRHAADANLPQAMRAFLSNSS